MSLLNSGTPTKTSIGLGNVDNVSTVSAFNSYGVRPTIYYTGSSWPARTVPAGYTGPVVWCSAPYASAPAPSGAVDNDIWERMTP